LAALFAPAATRYAATAAVQFALAADQHAAAAAQLAPALTAPFAAAVAQRERRAAAVPGAGAPEYLSRPARSTEALLV
jgi:hypothetical protein